MWNKRAKRYPERSPKGEMRLKIFKKPIQRDEVDIDFKQTSNGIECIAVNPTGVVISKLFIINQDGSISRFRNVSPQLGLNLNKRGQITIAS